MSYSNYQLNQRINNLQSQINNLSPISSVTLQDVLNTGNEASNMSSGTNTILLNNSIIDPSLNNTIAPESIVLEQLYSDINTTNKSTIARDYIELDIVPIHGGKSDTTSTLSATNLTLNTVNYSNVVSNDYSVITYNDGTVNDYTRQSPYEINIRSENVPSTDGIYKQIHTEPNQLKLSESDGTTENITTLTATTLSINGDYGTAGQVLTSGDVGGVLSWTTVGGGGSQNLASVLTEGSTADTDQTISLSSSTTTLSVGGNNTVFTKNADGAIRTNTLNVDGMTTLITDLSSVPVESVNIGIGGITLYDDTPNTVIISSKAIAINTNAGTAGQVLTSGGDTGILSWSDVGGNQNIASVLTAGSTADVNQTISLSNNDKGQITTLTLDALSTTFLSDDGTTTTSNELSYEQINLINKDDATSTTINSITIANNGIVYYDNTPNQIVYSSKNIYINGTPGTIGQVLTSGGDSGPLSWTTPGTVTPTLDEVLTAGNTTATAMIITDGAFGGYVNTLFYSGMTLEKSGLSTNYAYEKIDTTSAYEIDCPSLALNSDTITIGTSAGSASTVNIGHVASSGITQSTTTFSGNVSIGGLLTLQGNLFTGGISFQNNGGAGSYTVPSDAGRNTFYTMIASGTSTPTTITLPTDDIGGKYIMIYNIGTNSCTIAGSSSRKIYGGINGMAGGTNYPLYVNGVITLLSQGSAGFYIVSIVYPNTTSSAPYPIQTPNVNSIFQKGSSTSLSGTSATINFPVSFSANPSVIITPQGGVNVALTGSSTTGFTISYTTAPTRLNWMASA